MANLIFDRSRLLEVKSITAAKLPIYDFLQVCNSNMGTKLYTSWEERLEILFDLACQ